MNTWLAVFVGGGVGSVVRYAISRAVLAFGGGTIFPWATMVSNLLATALLAWLVVRWQVHNAGHDHRHALLAVGFCGGFSTMSTFSMENHQLLREGFYGMAALNIAITITLGILCFHFFARSS